MRKLRYIAQQKEIDQSGKAEFFSVKDQRKQQQDDIRYDIQGTEVNGDDGIKAAHQRLKGVNAKSSIFEHPDADAADQDAQCTHQNALA